MRKQIYLAMLMLLGALSTKAQSKIKDGTIPSSAFPNANAVLELESNKRGLLMPRIALTNTSSASPMTTHIAGMIVYNTATVNDVTPGYYYNDGGSWRKMAYITPSSGGGGNNINSTSSPIIISGGLGSVLSNTSIRLDSNALGAWLSKSPLKDSLAIALSAPGVKDSLASQTVQLINAGSITGKDLTNGNGIIITGGIGTTLKETSLRLDSSVVAKMLNQSPVKDSIAIVMSQSPIKDSINSVITNSITSGTITGKDLTNGNGIIITGGTGTTLKETSLRLDSSVVAKMLNQSPVKDSIAKILTQSPIKDSLASMEAWYSTVTNKGASKNTDSVYIMGKVGIGTNNPTAKLTISNNKSTTAPVMKLDTLLSGNTNDSIMVWRSSDSSVRKIAATTINPSIRQSIHFAVPATTWNSSTTPPSKNQMTNFTGGTGTFNNRTLYECLTAAERANMIVFEGLRMDILTENTTGSGSYIRPRFFNTTGSTITYTITSLFASRLDNMANGTVNASYYSYVVDGDDILVCSSSGMETLHFDVYFTDGKHYEGNVGGFVEGTTSTGTYHFWMDVTRVN